MKFTRTKTDKEHYLIAIAYHSGEIHPSVVYHVEKVSNTNWPVHYIYLNGDNEKVWVQIGTRPAKSWTEARDWVEGFERDGLWKKIAA